MAVILGNGGGANLPFKGSTAEVANLPVSQGTYYKLDATGKLVPATSAICATSTFNQTTLATSNGYSYYRANPNYVGGKAEITMPNGNSLYTMGAYINVNYSSVLFLVISPTGEQLSIKSNFGGAANWYAIQAWSTQYIGEDSQYYLFGCFVQGINSSNNNGDQYGLIVKVAKSDNTITISQVTINTMNSAALAYRSDDSAPRIYLARDKSVYCAEFLSTSNSTTDGTLTLSTGTVNSSYAATQVTTSTFTGIYDLTNTALIKYDDGSGNFLLMYPTSTSALVFKKILVASDGSHAVTDLTVSGLVLGTTLASQINAGQSALVESEVAGKYLLFFGADIYQRSYQKVSYDGSSVTVGGFQKYVQGAGSANYMFKNSDSTFNSSFNLSQYFYRYTEDKLYVTPRATYSTWSSNTKGAVWTLGTGSLTGTAVETDIFNALNVNPTAATTIGYNGSGVISQVGGSNTAQSIQAVVDIIFATAASTKERVAYARQSGVVGSTVNISLVEGITSSDALSSTYFLSKEDMYYDLDTAIDVDGSVIKSIQRGTNAFGADGTIAIASVDVNKTFINYHSWANTTYYPNNGLLTLTNSTTLTYDWFAAANTVQWEVIEYV